MLNRLGKAIAGFTNPPPSFSKRLIENVDRSALNMFDQPQASFHTSVAGRGEDVVENFYDSLTQGNKGHALSDGMMVNPKYPVHEPLDVGGLAFNTALGATGALGVGGAGAVFYDAYQRGQDKDVPAEVLKQQTPAYHTQPAPEYSEKMSPAAIAAAKGYHTQPAPEYSEKMSPAAIAAAKAAADTPVDGLEGLYTIRQGDTLGDLTGGDYELARKIAEYNNLEDWNKINSGQTLRMKGEWLTPSSRLLNNTLANIRYPG